MNTQGKLPVPKRPKSRKVREEAFVDGFDAEMLEELEDVFEADDMPFYDMCRRLERERSLGRDERYD